MAENTNPPSRALSRRRLLGGGAAALGVAGITWGATTVVERSEHEQQAGKLVEPFYGVHQAGIDTTPQAHGTFIGFDLLPGTDRAVVVGIMKMWSEDASRLTAGNPALADTERELAVDPARLTVTVGYGPGLFSKLGLQERQPDWFEPLPSYAIDRLDDRWGASDLLLQICGDDPVTIAHAVRVLTKNVRSLTTIRWTQKGFRNARGTMPEGTTMRNLMGQVDGTVNPAPGTVDFDSLIWHDGAGQSWLAGGTSLVLRRIRMEMDTWDELDRSGRELTMGRTLSNGAPLNGTNEFDEADFTLTDKFSIPVIPPGSHIARAHRTHEKEQFFRRVYNYDDAPESGQTSNSGLIFAAFQRDIAEQYLPVQQRLSDFDALNEWTTPIGSAVYLIPPGCSENDYLGSGLLG
ncbi:Dyp-type peroxidase [Rhodococcus sp. NPDC059969]|uniref:Dyp-type peroxidase n=1 Tax=Rhodococcus sp. NPDC059969 TaxID=3347018 RepID=UPI00366CD2D6